MKCSIENILQILPADAQIICRRPTATISGLRQIDDQGVIPDLDFLYVSKDAQQQQLLLQPLRSFLLYSEQDISENWVGPQTNLMVVHSLEDYIYIIEKITGMLSEQSALDNIAQQLISIIHSGGDIHKLIQYVYSIVNNPMMLVDVSFNLIAHAGTSVLRNEESWRYALENKMFSSKYISYIMHRSNISDDDHLVKGDIRVELPNEVTSVKQYSARVSQGSVVLGYLKLLEVNHPVTDFDLQVFQTLSYYAPFARTSAKGRIPDAISLAEDFLHSLLTGILSDKDEIISRQELYNLKFHKNLYLIGVNYVGPQINNDIIAFLLQQVRSCFHNNLVLWMDGSFIVLYDSSDANLVNNEQWREQLSASMESLTCVANVSMPFQELNTIKNYYKQTTFCSEFRTFSKDHESRLVLTYEEIFEYHMILSLSKEQNLNDLIHPIVKTLQSTFSSSDLLNTLFVYVRNQCSIPDTAKEMYLHYNTLKNRIARIKDLTGFCEDNSRDCFWIMLSERFLNFQDMKNKLPSAEVSSADDEAANME